MPPMAATGDGVPPTGTWTGQSLSYNHQQVGREEQSSQALGQLPGQDQPTGPTLTYPMAGADSVAHTDLSSQRNERHFSSTPNAVQQDGTAPSDPHTYPYSSSNVGHSEFMQPTASSYYPQMDGAYGSAPVSQGYEAQPPPFQTAYPGAAGFNQAQESSSLAPSYAPPQPQPVDSHQHNNQEEKEPGTCNTGGLLVIFLSLVVCNVQKNINHRAMLYRYLEKFSGQSPNLFCIFYYRHC